MPITVASDLPGSPYELGSDPLSYCKARDLMEPGLVSDPSLALEPEHGIAVISFSPWVDHPHARERIRSLLRALRSFTVVAPGKFQIFCSLPHPLCLDLDYVHVCVDGVEVFVEVTSIEYLDLAPEVHVLHPIRPLPAKWLARFLSVAAELLARQRNTDLYDPREVPSRQGWDTP